MIEATPSQFGTLVDIDERVCYNGCADKSPIVQWLRVSGDWHSGLTEAPKTPLVSSQGSCLTLFFVQKGKEESHERRRTQSCWLIAG